MPITQIGINSFSNLTLAGQWQIWNHDQALTFAACYNSRGWGDVGVAMVLGDGALNPSSTLGASDKKDGEGRREGKTYILS